MLNLFNSWRARVTKKANTHFVETDRLIDWVSRKTDSHGNPLYCRTPKPKVHKFLKFPIFFAAGMPYIFLKELTIFAIDKENDLYRDIFGRRVLLVTERFPCFDSYDFLYDNRYYRWYYLTHRGRLTCVYSEDGHLLIEVTEDVQVIKERAWKAMVRAGLIQDDILHL